MHPFPRHLTSLKNLFLSGFIMLVVLPLPALAQVPPRADPGVILRDLDREERAPSRLDPTIIVPERADDMPPQDDKKMFILKSVSLDNSTVYDNADMRAIYRNKIGQSVSFSDLNNMAAAMTRQYRNDGYVFSRVILPPQNVTDGVVRFRAVEGRIRNVQLVGSFTDDNGTIKKMADKIMTSGVANTKDIERYLLLIDDLPGITAKSFVQPSETAGGGDLVINIEQDSFEGAAGFDNRGSRPIGPYKGTLIGAFNSLFDIHDRTTIRGIMATSPRELRFADITHEHQIGAEGFKVKGRAAFTETEPGGNVRALGIQGDSQLYDLEGVYPMIRGRRHNVNLITGFNATQAETDLSGLTVANDHIRSVRGGTQFDFTDNLRGVNHFDLMLAQGLDMFGATNDGLGRSRANGDHAFLKANMTATRVQQLPTLWSLMGSATGQLSCDPLLASEEFTVGGQSFGRAYDSGELAGDNGYAVVAELRYGDIVNHDLLRSYQAYGFADYGMVKNKSPVIGEPSSDSLTSAGVGVRFNLAGDFSGYLELDKPLNQDVASENDRGARLFFNIVKRF